MDLTEFLNVSLFPVFKAMTLTTEYQLFFKSVNVSRRECIDVGDFSILRKII